MRLLYPLPSSKGASRIGSVPPKRSGRAVGAAALGLGLVLLAGAAPARSLPIGELRSALEHAHLGDHEAPESARTYRIGHLELDLSNGALYPVVVDDRVVGMFFDGDGEFTYQSADLIEAENFRANVQRVTGYKSEGGTITGKLEQAIVFDTRLVAAAPDQGTGAPDKLQSALSRHQARFADDWFVPIPSLIAQSLVEPPAEAVVAVQMTTPSDDLVYVHDGLSDGDESLAVMKPLIRGDRYPEVLSRQAVDGYRLDAQPARWVLRDVDVDLRNPEAEHLELVVRETIEPRVSLRTLGVDLWSRVWQDSDYYPYEIDGVTLEGDTPVPVSFSHHHDRLVLELPRSFAADEPIHLRFDLSGDILHRPAGHSFWWLPIGGWLPVPARLDMMDFTFHAVVKVAKPFKPFSMGRTVRRWEEDDLACVEYQLDKPVQYAVVLAGKYHSLTEERDGLKITLSSYAFSRDEPMRKIANNVFELVRFFEPYLGEFPFEELNIIQINAYGFGIAPPGVIYLTSEAFDPSPAGRAYRSELNARMAHEVAHMWWGHLVKMATFEDQWLSESTAEYYSAVAVGQLLGEHKFRQMEKNWVQQAGELDELDSIYLANQISGEKAYRERYDLLYAKGPLMLAALREKVGDQAFFTIMKSFVTNFRWQHVRTLDFVQLANFVTHSDLRPWFQEHLFGVE